MAARTLAAFAVFDLVHRNRADVAPVVKLFAFALPVEEVNNQGLQVRNARPPITNDFNWPIPQFLILKERSTTPVRGDRNQLTGLRFEDSLKFHLIRNFDISFFESVLQKHDRAGKQFFTKLDFL